MAGDGFSSPDPADVPDSDGEAMDDDDILIAFEDDDGTVAELVGSDVSCTECVHYQTCAVVATFRQSMGEYAPGDPDDDCPVDPTDLAAICDEYSPEPEVEP